MRASSLFFLKASELGPETSKETLCALLHHSALGDRPKYKNLCFERE